MGAEIKKKRRICVIGGGAAGMACAWSLTRRPEAFEVEVWEALSATGGVASTVAVGKEGVDINDQVQGGAPSYRNNLLFFEEFGHRPHPVHLRVAFGTGALAWTNHSDSDLVQRLRPEIARFGGVLKWINRLEFAFAFVPIAAVLRMWSFSEEFRNAMVFPLTALFFGTGNQTPNVSAAVVARVFLDPKLRLFEYSPTHLLASVPEMFAFPKLGTIFADIAANIPALVRTDAAVAKVERRGRGGVTVTDIHGHSAEFDDIVFACGAEAALSALGPGASWLERRLLRNVKYFNDLIVTHTDAAYMKKHYTMEGAGGAGEGAGGAGEGAGGAGEGEGAGGAAGHGEATDMYFVRTDPANRERIEMSFDLTQYQPHLKGGASVYQSIFLDDATKDGWTVGEISEDHVLKKRMTRQFSHSWRHFAFWVPFLRFLQGRKHTWYAGSWTLVNTHEVAVMSGLAAAERLGAPYPFPHDELATQQFDLYLKIAHGFFARRRRAT